MQRRKKEKGEGSAGPSRSKKGSPARTATPVGVAMPLKSEQWMDAAAQLAAGYNVGAIAQYADMLMQQQQQAQKGTPSPSPPSPTTAGAAYYQQAQAMYEQQHQQQRFLQGQQGGQGHLGLLSSASFERAQELQQGPGADKLPGGAEQERAADGVYAQ